MFTPFLAHIHAGDKHLVVLGLISHLQTGTADTRINQKKKTLQNLTRHAPGRF